MYCSTIFLKSHCYDSAQKKDPWCEWESNPGLPLSRWTSLPQGKGGGAAQRVQLSYSSLILAVRQQDICCSSAQSIGCSKGWEGRGGGGGGSEFGQTTSQWFTSSSVLWRTCSFHQLSSDWSFHLTKMKKTISPFPHLDSASKQKQQQQIYHRKLLRETHSVHQLFNASHLSHTVKQA